LIKNTVLSCVLKKIFIQKNIDNYFSYFFILLIITFYELITKLSTVTFKYLINVYFYLVYNKLISLFCVLCLHFSLFYPFFSRRKRCSLPPSSYQWSLFHFTSSGMIYLSCLIFLACASILDMTRSLMHPELFLFRFWENWDIKVWHSYCITLFCPSFFKMMLS